MGEEVEKKAVEKEESKKVAEEDEKKTTEESKAPPPPPPQEIVLRVYMHCEGCAKKVRKCLKGFQGVEEVETDCKAHKVIVKGEKADPLKVLGLLQRKCNRRVELVSPIPKPKTEEEKKLEETKESVIPEEKKPEIITAVAKVHMHCDACAQKIQKCILRMKGVESASVDMKSSQVTVKGGFEASKLVEYLYKKTGKHAVIMKTEPEVKKEETVVENEEENNKKISEEGDDKKEKVENEEQKEQEEKKSKEENQELAKAKAEEGAKTEKEEREGETEVVAVAELLRAHELYHHPMHLTLNQFNAPPYHHPIQFNTEYVYPPQMFSDENPNACSVM